MTAPAKPPVVHVYRVADGIVCFVSPYDGNATYLGPYVPSGEIVREWWEVRHYDSSSPAHVFDSQCEARTCKELNCGPKCRIVHVVRRKKVRA